LKFESPTIVSTGWKTAKAVEKWTLDAPICDSCHNSKVKRTLMLYVPMVVGVLVFAASLAISFSLSAEDPPIFLVLGGSLAAAVLSFYTLFLVLKRMPKAPLEVISAGPIHVMLWFENDLYGRMFSEANRDILLA